jgi:hypothetical protein
MSEDQSTRFRPPHHQPSPSSSTRPPPPAPPKSSSSARSSKSQRQSHSFAFPPLFKPNSSRTSLVPSTAEGRPIPLDNTTAESRTSALREFNSNYPSRHQYAKSTGAQSSTFSQPIIVRTYPGPPSRPDSASRGSVFGGGITRGGSGKSASSGPAAVVRRVLPFATSFGFAPPPPGDGMLSMARAKAKKRLEKPDEPAKLPPIEAFSFKSFMANIDPQVGTDIGADLDRIAEICARSRYSRSNQYDVHVAPHGSGEQFLASASAPRNQPSDATHYTLRPSPDDDGRGNRHRSRRSGGRRRSVAVGTLETIMSSSRSSEEQKAKKMSAADLQDEVRGRAVTKVSGSVSPTSSSRSKPVEQPDQDPQDGPKTLTRKKSTSFATAVIENTKHASDFTSPRSSATLLLSDPAPPQISMSSLETRDQDIDGSMAHMEDSRTQGLWSRVSGWMPWKPTSASEGGHVGHPSWNPEPALQDLLKNVDVKGKGVERLG